MFGKRSIFSFPKPSDNEQAGFISATCQGERCSMCGEPAAHKVGEEIAFDDPFPQRHNLTAYVCHAHFGQIMGRAARRGDIRD
ncbi:MAG: hypothetical protein EOP51_06105 [Sphingobacteriales bacterium]|nr:MAG: hypothetical protein EOP51_06105 [Sphingobacteriales bacterium]